MRWPWQDKIGPWDGKPDDYPTDTYVEIFLLWIAVALTALVAMSIAYYLTN